VLFHTFGFGSAGGVFDLPYNKSAMEKWLEDIRKGSRKEEAEGCKLSAKRWNEL